MHSLLYITFCPRNASGRSVKEATAIFPFVDPSFKAFILVTSREFFFCCINNLCEFECVCELKWPFDGQLCQKYSNHKLLKSDNPFPCYN